MSPLRLRAFLTGTSRRLAILLAVLGLGSAIVAHHGMPAAAMGGAHGEHATAACPAVLAAAGLIAVVGLVRRRRQRRTDPLPRPPLALGGPCLVALPPVAARPRDGPKVPLFLVLGVLRR